MRRVTTRSRIALCALALVVAALPVVPRLAGRASADVYLPWSWVAVNSDHAGALPPTSELIQQTATTPIEATGTPTAVSMTATAGRGLDVSDAMGARQGSFCPWMGHPGPLPE